MEDKMYVICDKIKKCIIKNGKPAKVDFIFYFIQHRRRTIATVINHSYIRAEKYQLTNKILPYKPETSCYDNILTTDIFYIDHTEYSPAVTLPYQVTNAIQIND